MEQLQQGFSDSTQKAGSDRIKQIGKMLDQCITINMYTIVKLAPKGQKYRSGHFDFFKIQHKYRPIGGDIKIILTKQKPSRDF